MMPEWIAAATIAADGGAPVTIESVLLNLGLPGVVILVLGIYAHTTIKSTEERSKRLEDDNRRLYQIMTDSMIPAVTKANEAVAEATTIMAEIRKQAEINAAVQAARKLHDD
jgi:hypothetical protein